MRHKYYKDFLAIFICVVIVIISSLLIGYADSEPKISFTADTTISLSGSDTTLYALSGSETDSITVSGSALTVKIPASSYFSIGTGSNTVLKTTPSGDSATLSFDTVYLSSGYVSQWTISGSGTNVSFTVGVPEAEVYYSVKANGTRLNYYKSSSAKTISFSYTGDLTQNAFQIIRENLPGGPSLPTSVYQAPATPEQGFSVLINNGADKTTKREIVLILNGGPDVKRMSISENKNFTNASQEPYATTKTWILSEGDGLKTIYAKFFTQYGQPSEIVSDCIVLETATPQQIQEEPETENAVEEEPVVTPPVVEKEIAKYEQPKAPVKTATPQKPATVPATTITPKTTVERKMSAPIEIIKKTEDDEITSSLEPQIVSEEKPILPEKKAEPAKTEMSIFNYVWQGVMSFLRRMWPF